MHLPASHSVVESLRLFSDACRATSETTPELLVLSKFASGTRPHCNTRWPGQRVELVCSFGPFIAYLAMSFAIFFRPAALRRSTPFRYCGEYSRWAQQLDAAEELGPLAQKRLRSGRHGRKTWPEGVAGRRGQNASSKDVAGRRGRKAWSEGVVRRRARNRRS